MTRDLIIRLALDETGHAMFEGRWAMVVPLSEGESREVGTTIIAVHEAWAFGSLGVQDRARHLATLEEVLDSRGSAEPEIRKTLDMWKEPVTGLHSLMDRARQLLGRAYFIGGTEQKGPMQ